MTETTEETSSEQADAGDPPSTTSGPALSVVILAAGQGTRMRSRTHKVLHELAGKPMIHRVLDLAASVGGSQPVVVLGHLPEQVRSALPPTVRTVIQEPQLGTGHAVQTAAEPLRADGAERLLALLGDIAVYQQETLQALVDQPIGPDAPIALLNARVPDPHGYGRVLRRPDGAISGMVEEIEATAEQRQVDEIWSGVMLLWTPWLWEHLWRLEPRAKGEYYLPDLVNLALSEGKSVLSVIAPHYEEVLGVNDRAQLAEANAILWRRTARRHMRNGVTILDPNTTYIEPEVEIEPDAVIRPGCHLRGATRIAAGAEIGPNTELTNATIGEGSRVKQSVIEDSTIGRGVQVGPFSHLRGGATIEDGVELGNYAEVKNSRVGQGTKMHHFSYLGDADVGRNVNIGAGTITMNYDGARKHRTVIEDEAFVGSDTMLRAPVRIGRGARTGGGSVVTKDVPAGETWVGVPARPLPARDGADKR